MTFEKFYMIMNTIAIGEMSFSVQNHIDFQHCWLGVEIRQYILKFVLDLSEDGNNYYEFESFDEMVNASMFNGNSLKEVWNDVKIDRIDGVCEEDYNPECSFNFYNYLNNLKDDVGKVLLTYKPSSWCILKYLFKIVIWVPLIFTILGLVLVLFSQMKWSGMFFFGGISVISLIISLIAGYKSNTNL